MNVRDSKSSKRVPLGFTMSALLVGVSFGSFLLMGASAFSLSKIRDFASIATYPELGSKDRNITALLTQDIHRASAVQSASTHQLVLKTPATGATRTVTYTYDPNARILTRYDGDTSRRLLTGLEDFAFSLFQRPAAGGAYDALAPATASNARLVACRWSCSRTLGGKMLGGERVQIAPVLLRNR